MWRRISRSAVGGTRRKCFIKQQNYLHAYFILFLLQTLRRYYSIIIIVVELLEETLSKDQKYCTPNLKTFPIKYYLQA